MQLPCGQQRAVAGGVVVGLSRLIDPHRHVRQRGDGVEAVRHRGDAGRDAQAEASTGRGHRASRAARRRAPRTRRPCRSCGRSTTTSSSNVCCSSPRPRSPRRPDRGPDRGPDRRPARASAPAPQTGTTTACLRQRSDESPPAVTGRHWMPRPPSDRSRPGIGASLRRRPSREGARLVSIRHRRVPPARTVRGGVLLSERDRPLRSAEVSAMSRNVSCPGAVVDGHQVVGAAVGLDAPAHSVRRRMA